MSSSLRLSSTYVDQVFCAIKTDFQQNGQAVVTIYFNVLQHISRKTAEIRLSCRNFKTTHTFSNVFTMAIYIQIHYLILGLVSNRSMLNLSRGLGETGMHHFISLSKQLFNILFEKLKALRLNL